MQHLCHSCPATVTLTRNYNKTEGKSILFHAVCAVPSVTGPHTWLAQWAGTNTIVIWCPQMQATLVETFRKRQTTHGRLRNANLVALLVYRFSPAQDLNLNLFSQNFLWCRSHVSCVIIVSDLRCMKDTQVKRKWTQTLKTVNSKLLRDTAIQVQGTKTHVL